MITFTVSLTALDNSIPIKNDFELRGLAARCNEDALMYLVIPVKVNEASISVKRFANSEPTSLYFSDVPLR